MATSANSLLQKPGGAGDFRGCQGQPGDLLGNCLGWYLVKEGRQDQVVHLWAYQSRADREARRDALYANPAWQDYVSEVMAMDFWSAGRISC
jgi:NIPSNAP